MQKNRGCKGHGDGSWLSDCSVVCNSATRRKKLKEKENNLFNRLTSIKIK
jgi:hypothetical protein